MVCAQEPKLRDTIANYSFNESSSAVQPNAFKICEKEEKEKNDDEVDDTLVRPPRQIHSILFSCYLWQICTYTQGVINHDHYLAKRKKTNMKNEFLAKENKVATLSAFIHLIQ